MSFRIAATLDSMSRPCISYHHSKSGRFVRYSVTPTSRALLIGRSGTGVASLMVRRESRTGPSSCCFTQRPSSSRPASSAAESGLPA